MPTPSRTSDIFVTDVHSPPAETHHTVDNSGRQMYCIEERRTVVVTSNSSTAQFSLQDVGGVLRRLDSPSSGTEGSSIVIDRSSSATDRTSVVTDRFPDATDRSSNMTDRPVKRSRPISLQERDILGPERRREGGRGESSPQSSPTYSSSHRKTPSSTTLRTPVVRETPPSPGISSWAWVTPPRPRILFYHKHDPHYGFTNFSAHPVDFNGKRYPTSEHLFQSFKFQKHRPNLAEHIRTCSDYPSMAFSEARRFQPEVRADWKEVNVSKMDETLYLKFTQHRDLKEELLATGDAELVEDSDRDAFWGVGPDGKGRNELGKALERLRTRLRK